MAKMMSVLCTIALAVAGQQASTGEIAGNVGLPDVRVIVQADGATTSTTFTSDAGGRFSAPRLPPGTYFVSFYLKDYKYLTRAGVSVSANSRAQVDVTLEKEPPDAYGAKEPMTLAMDTRSRASSILPRVIRDTSSRSSTSRVKCTTWRPITSRSRVCGGGRSAISSSAVVIGASGLRSS